jgi:hypothetical protein
VAVFRSDTGEQGEASGRCQLLEISAVPECDRRVSIRHTSSRCGQMITFRDYRQQLLGDIALLAFCGGI